LYQSLCNQTCLDFDWLVIDDGSTDDTQGLIRSFIEEGHLPIRYIYKENGGLYTGYNTAYANIETELNVCIDSDDALPYNAVETILRAWRERGSRHYAGLIGLDSYLDSGKPIGGRFPDDLKECFFLDLFTKKLHRGDTKLVMRTDLMKTVSPMIGFPGEKNFNPIYLFLQVCDNSPLLVLNEPLCLVEYQQNDSMSRHIWRQYLDSPRSFAKLRRLEMSLNHNTRENRYRCAIHYVAECLLANKKHELFDSSDKFLVAIAFFPGVLLRRIILWKNKTNK
jgi:glycosyltransferase involved in cell wall biosynthesis